MYPGGGGVMMGVVCGFYENMLLRLSMNMRVAHLSMRSAQNTMGTRGTPE